MEVGITRGPLSQMAMELHHRLAEQGLVAVLRGTVGVELDEEPVGARGDLDPGFEPELQAVDVRRLAGLETGELGSRKSSPPAPTPVEQERTLDQHQAIGGRWTGADVNPPVVRAGPVGVVDRVIDAVDLARLGPAWGGREGEIRVATGLAQDIELVVHATPAAVWARVVKRPVAVDETVCTPAAPAVARQKTMAA